jgi:DNA invertase Pin-like site-specific DNA recombinase
MAQRAIIFTRVSTSSQNIDRQLNELVNRCEDKEWKLAERYADTISGAVPYSSRPGFSKVLKSFQNKKADILVVHEISRLGRNTSDVLNCIEELNSAGAGVYIMNVNVLVKPDRADPSANLIVAILASLATHERELMRQRIMSGLKNSTKTSGRPKGARYSIEDYEKKYPTTVKLIKLGCSLKEVSSLTKVSYRTVLRINKVIR